MRCPFIEALSIAILLAFAATTHLIRRDMNTTTAAAPALRQKAVTPALLLGVLGVVYGDIGTSPLYTLSTCLAEFGENRLTPGTILGILSMIFWSLIIVVTVKYVTFVRRADNNGE